MAIMAEVNVRKGQSYGLTYDIIHKGFYFYKCWGANVLGGICLRVIVQHCSIMFTSRDHVPDVY